MKIIRGKKEWDSKKVELKSHIDHLNKGNGKRIKEIEQEKRENEELNRSQEGGNEDGGK